MKLPVMPPVEPMLAKLVADIPPGLIYEPKWDGFRSIVFRDGDEVEIGSRNGKPMTRYFPDVVAAVKENLPPRCVLDGEIVVASPETGALDFWALQQRVHPAASRVNMLAEKTPASLVAFDLLALGDDDYMPRPFAERRATLETALADARPPVHVTPVTQDVELARRWFEHFEGAGLDGLIAKPPEGTYRPDKRVMFKIKHERTADCVVAGYRVHKTTKDAIGSLLLGLYDDPESSVVPQEMRDWFSGDGGDDAEADTGPQLVSVGVVGAFPMATRRELFAELQPLVTDFADHPWSWAEQFSAAAGRGEGQGHRWSANKDQSFVPLRPERVVEVRYDYMEGFRFRHVAQFVRWRPDREPLSCGYDQLEQPPPCDLAEVLSGRLT